PAQACWRARDSRPARPVALDARPLWVCSRHRLPPARLETGPFSMPSASRSVGGLRLLAMWIGSRRSATGPACVLGRGSVGARGDQAALDGPGSDLGAGTDAELVQDVLDMLGCGTLGDHQAFANLAVGESLRDQRRNLTLS